MMLFIIGLLIGCMAGVTFMYFIAIRVALKAFHNMKDRYLEEFTKQKPKAQVLQLVRKL